MLVAVQPVASAATPTACSVDAASPPLAALQAAVVADQNAKLSIFATRPAIYAPLYNFITETMGTTVCDLHAMHHRMHCVCVLAAAIMHCVQPCTACVRAHDRRTPACSQA